MWKLTLGNLLPNEIKSGCDQFKDRYYSLSDSLESLLQLKSKYDETVLKSFKSYNANCNIVP